MTSTYDVGDHVVVDGGHVQIVKVLNDDFDDVLDPSSNALYLVKDLNQNHFTYQSQEKMTGSEESFS